jgi:beta-galactosidase
VYHSADRMVSSRQGPFLITETNAQAIGAPWLYEPAYDGQWRQAAWALVTRGATMIEYWHWHTLHFGAETYWGGILPHSQEPGRTYAQLAQLGAEFDKAGAAAAGIVPDADITLVYSNETKWSLEEKPTLGSPAGGVDHRSYQTILDSYYRGAFDAGLQIRIVHVSQLFDAKIQMQDFAAAHPVLITAGLLIAHDDQLRWLERYADAGGHLVLGIRTGYEDQEARARIERKPAFLADAAGVW